MRAGTLDRRIEIRQRVTTTDANYGTRVEQGWVLVASVWAEVRDMLPSRAEQIADGIDMAAKPCRVRMRYRDDVTSEMRLRIDGLDYAIVSGPAMMGRREAMEVMAVRLSTEGARP